MFSVQVCWTVSHTRRHRIEGRVQNVDTVSPARNTEQNFEFPFPQKNAALGWNVPSVVPRSRLTVNQCGLGTRLERIWEKRQLVPRLCGTLVVCLVPYYSSAKWDRGNINEAAAGSDLQDNFLLLCMQLAIWRMNVVTLSVRTRPKMFILMWAAPPVRRARAKSPFPPPLPPPAAARRRGEGGGEVRYMHTVLGLEQ